MDSQSNQAFLSIVILTFNRPVYLTALLESIERQSMKEGVEIIIVDNGCEKPITESHQDAIKSIGIPTTVIRHNRNILSHIRVVEGIEKASGIFIFCPGDDDVLEIDCVLEFKKMYETQLDSSLLSVSSICVNSKGYELQRSFSPKRFIDQPTALASLLASNQYWLPATAFRKDFVDFSYMPYSRTAFDWWIWIQCLIRGPACVSKKFLVQYRIHEKQEQHNYGNHQFELDSVRIVASLLVDSNFISLLKSWDKSELQKFFQIIIQNGILQRKNYFGSLMELILVDLLRKKIDPLIIEEVFTKASIRLGVIPTIDILKNYLVNPDIISLPSYIWEVIDVGAIWDDQNKHHLSWISMLNIPLQNKNLFVVRFHSVVKNKIKITIHNKQSGEYFSTFISAEPNERDSTILLRELYAIINDKKEIGLFTRKKFITQIFLKLELNIYVNRIVGFIRNRIVK